MQKANREQDVPLETDTLPLGLPGLFDAWFLRQFPDAERYRKRVAPLLGLILAAETPVPEAVLDESMGEILPDWDEVASAATLESLGSLFERRGDGWAPFHKSLRDWLSDREKTPVRHLVRVTPGQNRLAGLLWRHFMAAAQDPGVKLSAFLLRELPALAAGQTAATRAGWVRQAGNWDTLGARCRATIALLRDRRSWAAMLAWCDLSSLLATEAGEPGWRLLHWIAVERGGALQLLGRTADAANAYRASLTFASRLATADPENPAWQRELFAALSRIGDILQAQGNLAQAAAAYRSGIEKIESVASGHPNNVDWQRDLSISHERIGDVLQRQGDLKAAINAYQASMTIRQKLAEADPDNADWQRDLSFSHTALGNVLAEQGNSTAALAAYTAALSIDDRLAATDVQNAESQRDLFVSLLKLTDWLIKAKDRAAACPIAQRLSTQAHVLHERFPQDPQREDYLRWAADRLAQACGPAA